MANTYHQQVETLLKAIPSLGGRVYDGYAPGTIPTDGLGFILPYVLAFSGTPTDLENERDLTGLADRTTDDWRIQTNCVGPDPAKARACAQLVADALTNAHIGGWLLPDNDAFKTSLPIKDDDVKPARFFLPLFWRLTATHH